MVFSPPIATSVKGSNYIFPGKSLAWLSSAPIVEPVNSGEIQRKFEKLSKKWDLETLNYSSMDSMVKHPAYISIIKLGRPVVPILLAALKINPDHWFYALRQITGADPIPNSSAGNLRKMADAWLSWGERQGLR